MIKKMPNEFHIWKKNFLTKKDKSNKGKIDKPILKLIETINKKEDYFTTSSCSGRTTVWIEPKTGIKKDVEFVYETHSKTNIKNFIEISFCAKTNSIDIYISYFFTT